MDATTYSAEPQSLGTMLDPIIIDFVRKTFYICGYILLYLITTCMAAGVAYASALIFEKWILEPFIAKRLRYHDDDIEISRQLWMLICCMGFLIAAVGMLFLHLAGVMPQEYDEPALRIGLALFGLIVFVTMSLMALFVLCGGYACAWKLMRLEKPEAVDEETGLVSRRVAAKYGSLKGLLRVNQQPVDREPVDQEPAAATKPRNNKRRRCTIPRIPALKRPSESTWIKLRRLSSVREIDVRWMEVPSSRESTRLLPIQ